MQPMRRIVLAGAFFLLWPLLHAQLSEKPDSWTRLEGHFLSDFEPSNAFFLRNLCLAEIRKTGPQYRPPAAAMDLIGTADRAFQTNSTNAAARYYARVLAVLRGQTPGEWLEVAGSLRFRLDRRVAAPGAIVHARLDPALLLDRPIQDTYSVRLSLAPAGGGAARELPPLQIERLEDRDIRLPTADLPEGAYLVRFALLDKAGRTLSSAARPLLLSARFFTRLAALEAQADQLAAAGAARKSPRHAAAVETILFTTELCRRATREPVGSYHQNLHPLLLQLSAGWPEPDSTDPLRPDLDLPQAEALAGSLLQGADPLAARTGDLRLAYRSGVEKPYQPYRVYLPPSYEPGRKWPLIVALRSYTGDDGTLFDLCPPGAESLLLKLARERGYLVAAPEGLGPYSYFAGTAADDVFHVIDRMRASYSVDPRQVFLAGNNMGGMGAMMLTLDPRARFAAVAAVAATPIRQDDFSRAPNIPVLLLQAPASRIQTTLESRRFGFVLAKGFKLFDYDELPGADQANAFPLALPRVFQFFDAVRAGAWKPSGKPVPLPDELRTPPPR